MYEKMLPTGEKESLPDQLSFIREAVEDGETTVALQAIDELLEIVRKEKR